MNIGDCARENTMGLFCLSVETYHPLVRSDHQSVTLCLDVVDPKTFEVLDTLELTQGGIELPLTDEAVIRLITDGFELMRDRFIYDMTDPTMSIEAE